MKKVDFENGSITGNILQTAFPMLVAQVLHLLYSIVDRIYIGRIPGTGTDALGAVGLCFPIIILITGFTNMFGMGGAPLFSIQLGKKKKEEARQVLCTAFRLLIMVSFAITVTGELFGGPLLKLFGAGEEELATSLSYLRIYLTGTVPLMLSTGMNPYITAMGFAVIGMLSVTVGAVANLLLDPVFIFVFGMGVEGAALATVISQVLSMMLVLFFLFGKKNEFRPSFGFSFPFAWDIVGLGLAPFIMQVTNSLVQIACNQMLMHLGGMTFVSVMTIISSVRSILDVPVMAVTEGTSPIISYNYGARRPDRVRKAFIVMMMLAVPYTFLTWIAVLVRPVWFIRIFSTDREILSDASRALHLYFAAFIFQSLQYSGQTVFKALNKRKQAIFFSLLRKAVLVVPLTYLLPLAFHLGTDGVFLAEPVSNVIGGIACFTTMLITILPELKAMEN